MSSRSPRKAAAALRLGDLGQPLQHLGRAARQVVGKGAVVDQGGHLGEVGLHRLEGRAGGEFTRLRGVGQPCLNGLHVLRPDGARVQLRQQALEGARQGGGGPRQAAQGLPVRLSARRLAVGVPGQGHGVVTGFGQEGGGLLQLYVAVGQLAQSRLSGQRLAVGLGAQCGEQLGTGGVGHLSEGDIQLARRRGQLGEGVLIGVVQHAPVLCRPGVALHCKPGGHREGPRQKAGGQHLFSPFLHDKTPPFTARLRKRGRFMCGKYKLKKGAKKVEQIIGGLHAQKRNFQAGRPNPIFQRAEEKATAGHLLIVVGRGLHPAVGGAVCAQKRNDAKPVSVVLQHLMHDRFN